LGILFELGFMLYLGKKLTGHAPTGRCLRGRADGGTDPAHGFPVPGFDSALIIVDGANLKQLFDASGTVGDGEPYSRSELAWPLPASAGDS
jgi:hypothetical protein